MYFKGFKIFYFVGFEVLTAVVMKYTILSCSPLRVNRRFGRTCRLHLQGKKLATEETSSKPSACPENGGDMFLRNVGCRRTMRRYIPEDGTLRILFCSSRGAPVNFILSNHCDFSLLPRGRLVCFWSSKLHYRCTLFTTLCRIVKWFIGSIRVASLGIAVTIDLVYIWMPTAALRIWFVAPLKLKIED
jgi:hypothetical protein